MPANIVNDSMIAFQSNAHHCKCVYFVTLTSRTLTYGSRSYKVISSLTVDPDVDILKMDLCIKCKVSTSKLSKVRALTGQTDTIKHVTRLHLQNG